MAKKYLVEFLAQWIRDEELRKKVLYREETALTEWGLDQYQRTDLLALDEGAVLKRLKDELKNDFKINLGAVLQDILNTGGLSGGGGGAAAASGYEQDLTHVRGVEPAQIPKGVESLVIVRGHGWDDSPAISFVPPGGGQPVPGVILDIDCDVDVWQRATVKVTLPSEGSWRVKAYVASNTAGADSTEPVDLQVV